MKRIFSQFLLNMILKINEKKNLFVNFLAVYGLNFFKILKIFRLLGISLTVNSSKIDSNLKVVLMRIVKQNYFYSKDNLKRKTKLNISYYKKIKSFRSYFRY